MQLNPLIADLHFVMYIFIESINICIFKGPSNGWISPTELHSGKIEYIWHVHATDIILEALCFKYIMRENLIQRISSGLHFVGNSLSATAVG
jgi:hypothetical protein